MTRRLLRWVFRDALKVRDRAIRLLQAENRDLALQIALLRAEGTHQ